MAARRSAATHHSTSVNSHHVGEAIKRARYERKSPQRSRRRSPRPQNRRKKHSPRRIRRKRRNPPRQTGLGATPHKSATHPTEGRTKKTLSPKTYWLPLAGDTYLSCKDNKRTQRALLKPMLSILTTAGASSCSRFRGINKFSLREK
jgi:hypothetical protein